MAEAIVPTKEEIRQLAHWGRVAFAARCARRAQPFFAKHWPDALREHLEAVEYAIQVAENAAASPFHVKIAHAHTVANAAADAAVASSDADAAASANVAAYAAAAAADAATYTYVSSREVTNAAAAAARAGVPVANIRGDFDLLLERSKHEKWDDKTPVPPSVFPPLDAELPEPEQPEPLTVMTAEELQADETIIGKIRFFGKPGITAQELAPHIRSTYQALNQLTLAKYGKYLKLADFKRLVLQYAGVPQS